MYFQCLVNLTGSSQNRQTQFLIIHLTLRRTSGCTKVTKSQAPTTPAKKKKEEEKHKQAVTHCFRHNSIKSAMIVEMCTSQTKTRLVYNQNFKFKQTNKKEELIFNTRMHRTQILNQTSVSIFLQLLSVPC